MNNIDLKYPVYIISKGRHESRLTSKTLEPQEYDDYASVIDPSKILVLPFSNLGKGSIPARNWVWEHSIAEGHEKHWLMDDNIIYFFRLHRNIKIPVADGAILKCMEDFTDRFDNIGISGPHYDYFAPRKQKMKPYVKNARVYSCSLINNSVPFRWRGKYNEDTDLCLRMFKAGYGSILFNAFLQGKVTTLTMKGGNTDNVYVDGDNRLKFAESLQKQHPDVVRITKKFGRWHHEVDYRRFRKIDLKPKNLEIPKGYNNYGMRLILLDEEQEEKERVK